MVGSVQEDLANQIYHKIRYVLENIDKETSKKLLALEIKINAAIYFLKTLVTPIRAITGTYSVITGLYKVDSMRDTLLKDYVKEEHTA